MFILAKHRSHSADSCLEYNRPLNMEHFVLAIGARSLLDEALTS